MKAIINKQARFDYEILDSFEAGLVLTGQEVKSVKSGSIKLDNAFITIKNNPKNELFLSNARIAPYTKAHNLVDYDPTRPRKLLVKAAEITKLIGKIKEKGLTIVPLKVYTKSNLVKVECGLGRGKKKFEKKATLKKRDLDRDMNRALKNSN
ncbi:SsrA-binding protein [Candidatus Falkowbacteria bacterium CG10_big_fil_rev_8_21_14_0_10_39_11]|uniref:SsrA-binding protein n=1 Tax=Candidatus Falkowbacteria bacterium CG10_big_fil_rev_8_21_14_0_10_39_11 TaxID=1974565 RepID=A0A2H0V3V8_9BACT|nr:MAG: SsrA-binding protein [Candidatus Falkowbacteria bacterium CG10_big_fil_rev_8_21_14_0_10_39_11]